MGNIWEKIKTIYAWCCDNTDIILIGILVVIGFILAPFIIGIIKSVLKGIWAVIKIIFSVIKAPFSAINKLKNSFNSNKGVQFNNNNYMATMS